MEEYGYPTPPRARRRRWALNLSASSRRMRTQAREVIQAYLRGAGEKGFKLRGDTHDLPISTS